MSSTVSFNQPLGGYALSIDVNAESLTMVEVDVNGGGHRVAVDDPSVVYEAAVALAWLMLS